MQYIYTLAKNKEYQQRMIFCRIFRYLYKEKEFIEYMKNLALKLSEDKIINVKINLATVFKLI